MSIETTGDGALRDKLNGWQIAAFVLVLSGISLLAYDVVRGEAQAGIVLIVPYIIGGGIFSLLGILCIILAFFTYIVSLSRQGRFSELGIDGDDEDFSDIINKNTEQYEAESVCGTKNRNHESDRHQPNRMGRDEYIRVSGDEHNRRSRYGGVVLIGPFPLIFGSDRKIALIAAGMAIIFLAVMFILLLYILRN